MSPDMHFLVTHQVYLSSFSLLTTLIIMLLTGAHLINAAEHINWMLRFVHVCNTE